MIKQITVESYHDIDVLLDDLVEARKNTPFVLSDSVKEDVLDWISKGDAKIYAVFQDNDPLGFVMNYPILKKIGIIHVRSGLSDTHKIKQQLFDEAFYQLSQKTDVIRTGGPSIDTEDEKYIKSKGFKKYLRKSMMLKREKIKLLLKPELPEGLKFGTYNPAMREDAASLIFEANMGHHEAKTFPDLFGSREAAFQFLESIEELLFYPFSKVIIGDEGLVGICIVTFSSEDRGHISNICVHKMFHGKGLARNLLTYTFNHIVLEMEKMESITFDVTDGNPIRELFLELGFDDVEEFILYMWCKDS